MIGASDHIFQYGIVPLSLEQDSKILWKNPTPNAASCVRHIYLIRLHEDDFKVLEIVLKLPTKIYLH